jgi:hypothetical protein
MTSNNIFGPMFTRTVDVVTYVQKMGFDSSTRGETVPTDFLDQWEIYNLWACVCEIIHYTPPPAVKICCIPRVHYMYVCHQNVHSIYDR